MDILDIQPRELNLKSFKNRKALPEDATVTIVNDTLVRTDGKPVILYKNLSNFISPELRRAIRSIKFNNDIRTSGLKTQAAVFGYNPRHAIRRDYCSATLMSYRQPEQHEIVSAFGQVMTDLYNEYFPDIYAEHRAIAEEKILPEWRIPGTPFTSGIVNYNSALKYHFDGGNIRGLLSNMLVIRDGMAGGKLVCPEYDLSFSCSDETVVLFNGQTILHGVTPLNPMTADAYRYSVVYYTLQQMWSCLPLGEEIKRVRQTHLAKERKRANGQTDATKLTYDRNPEPNTSRSRKANN